MTWLLIALVVATAAFACSALLLTYAVIRGWREERREKRERIRRAAHHERMAAENGRPHGSVTVGAKRRR